MQEDITGKTKESLFWNIILPTFFQVFRFGISLVLTRLLDPKDFGIVGLANIIIFYSNSLSNFGLSTALIQKNEITDQHINSVFTINLTISFFLALVVCLLSNTIAVFFNIPELESVLRVMSVIFIVTSFHTIPATLLRREIRFKKLSVVELVSGIFQTLLTLFLVFAGLGYWSMIFGMLCSHLLGVILINRQVHWVPRLQYDHQAVQGILNFSIWNFILSQVYFAYHYIDKSIIGKMWGSVFLGYYDKAFSFAYIPVESISQRVSGVMFSSFSRNQANNEELRSHFAKSISVSTLICFPLHFGLAVIAPYFVIVLLGNKWEPMINSLQILSLSFSLETVNTIIESVSLATGNHKNFAKRRIYCTTIMIVLCLIGAQWGINGVALAVLLSSILSFLTSFDLVAKSTSSVTWSRLLSALAPATTGSLIMFCMVAGASVWLFPDRSFLNLLLLTFMGAIVYLGCFFYFNFESTKFIKKEIRIMLNRMLGSRPKA